MGVFLCLSNRLARGNMYLFFIQFGVLYRVQHESCNEFIALYMVIISGTDPALFNRKKLKTH